MRRSAGGSSRMIGTVVSGFIVGELLLQLGELVARRLQLGGDSAR